MIIQQNRNKHTTMTHKPQAPPPFVVTSEFASTVLFEWVQLQHNIIENQVNPNKLISYVN